MRWRRSCGWLHHFNATKKNVRPTDEERTLLHLMLSPIDEEVVKSMLNAGADIGTDKRRQDATAGQLLIFTRR
jgi:hypothetical protein